MQRAGRCFMVWMLGCVLLSSTVLCGCGKKGPLYLPDEANVPKQDKQPSPLTGGAKAGKIG